MTHIVYPGTFDPITKGHVYLIERAAKLFSIVTIAIANSQKKKPLFDLQERITLCEQALKHVPSVAVVGFEGLTVDLAKQRSAQAVLRGLRSTTDFEYELQLARMNRAMDDNFETVFLPPSPNLGYVSSSLIREIAAMGGSYQQFVPENVATALAQKFS